MPKITIFYSFLCLESYKVRNLITKARWVRTLKNGDKLVKLHELIKRIENCLRCYEEFEDVSHADRIRIRDWYLNGPWFFPPDKHGVKGFFGTSDVMFVCPRPSTGSFDDPASKLFYKLLRKYGFSKAHVTDIVKCRRKAGIMSSREIGNCFQFLLREKEILQPRIVVAVGDEAYNEIRDHFRNVRRILHYAAAYRYKKTEKLERQLEQISKQL